MIGVIFVIFTLFDGMTRSNLAPEAANARGWLITALVGAWLFWLWRANVRLGPVWSALIGILAMMTISEARNSIGGVGISTWLIATAFVFSQTVAERDWRDDFSLAALIIAYGVMAAVVSGHAPPVGMLNRNVVAGTLGALAPAAIDRWRPDARRWHWWIPAFVAGAVVATGSRGASVALAVAIVVYVWPQRLIGDKATTLALAVTTVPVVAIALLALISIRPATFALRIACAEQVLTHWIKTSPIFGLGPGGIYLLLQHGENAINAHSALPTILAIGGFVGISVILAAIAATSDKVTVTVNRRWQLSSLAFIATHSIVDEVTSWWPVVIILAIVAVDVFKRSTNEPAE